MLPLPPQVPMLASAAAHGAVAPGAASYVVPTAFPTSVYSSYYVPAGPTQEPQPAIYDPVLNMTFPLNLTDPSTIPSQDPDPVLYPEAAANVSDQAAEAIISTSIAQILAILAANHSGLADNCSKCTAALSVAQVAARLVPSYLPDAFVSLCQSTGFQSNSTCQSTYEASSFGAVWTQVLAKADVAGLDGRYICSSLSTTFCSAPPVIPKKATFPKEKPAQVSVPVRSGERVKVFHLSDMHLDPRYEYGTEANCSSSLCCHPSTLATANSSASTDLPAPLYGYYKCDSPYYLALAALQSIGPLTNTSADDPPAMTFYTGDMVTHVATQGQLSREFVENVEDSVLQMFKAYIGGPIFAALGNHDSSPENNDAPHAIDNDGPLGEQFSWNFNHVSKLWEHYGWINSSTAAEAALHYGAYAVTHPLGVRVITLNTDFYYKSNYFSFLHAADPDYSGIFTFLIDELQKAEDAGQRAYIMGHVLTGWDGTNPMPNGADYFYQIVERYSPHVIAGVFFGHTHEDFAFIYYNNNGTNQASSNAIMNAWVGPSLTPLTNLNSGYRMYEVDTGSFEVMEAYTFYSDVSSFSRLQENGRGPVWEFEYSTRQAYGGAAGWADDDPLNATFWHAVTEAMERNRTLVTLQNTFQGKSSVMSPNCTNQACQDARKSLSGPGGSCTDDSEAVTTSASSKSRPTAANLQPPTNGHAAHLDDPVIESPPPRSAPGSGTWNAWDRYCSGSSKNSSTKYENDPNKTMSGSGTRKITIGAVRPCNNLDGRHPPPATLSSPTTTTKRPMTSDSIPTNRPKRQRTSEGLYDDRSIPLLSSPDAREQFRRTSSFANRSHSGNSASVRSTSPVTKNGARDSQSLRSSGDRSFKGGEASELRATSQRTSVKGGGRRRHKKNRQTQDVQEPTRGQKASQGSKFLHKSRLVQCRENTDDPIVDDEVTIIEEPWAPKTKPSAPAFATATFQMGISEDEEPGDDKQDRIGTRPATNRLESAADRPEEHQGLDRKERPAASQDALQSSRDHKRRSQTSGQADLPRNNGSAKHTPGRQNGKPRPRVLHVESAVGEPHHIYLSQDDTDESCSLSWRASDGAFFPINQGSRDIEELRWMTPELHSVNQILYNKESPIVMVKLLRKLLIKFMDNEDASEYVHLCQKESERKQNKNVSYDDIDAERLEKTFSHTLDVVRKYNKRQSQVPLKPEVRQEPESKDLALLARLQDIGTRSAKPTRSEAPPAVEADDRNGNVQEKKMHIRIINKDFGTSSASKNQSQRQPLITPDHEKQMRRLVSDFDDGGGGREEPRFSLRSTPRPSDQTATSHTQRNLRSSCLVRSPPPPERWTMKNPNWIEEHNWKAPLLYERTTVNDGDIACLDEGTFLNDAIISFYAKYLHKQLEEKDATSAGKVYIFNSFFWETLRAKGYDGVKSWTTKIDLLSYDYIIVPINQNAHWYLAIICNPGSLIPKDEPDDEVHETADEYHGDGGALSDNTPDANVANVTSDLSQVSIEDDPGSSPATNLEEVNGKSRAKKTKASKRPRKYGPKDPRVITLDSLNSPHSAVASQLKTYLIQEIKERKGLDIPAPSSFGTSAKDIPMQQNFTDCGVYLLGYIEEFMKDPRRFTRRILRQEGRDWDVNAPELRNKIRELILKQQKSQQEAFDKKRRQKKALDRPKANAQTPAAPEGPPAKSSTGSEQNSRRASRSPAVDRQNTNRSTNSPALRVNGNANSNVNIERADSKTSSSELSTPRAQSSSPIRSAPTEDCEGGNVNASLVVNLDDSFETPNPKRSSGSRQSSESRQARRDQPVKGDYDARQFLPPLHSSPPTWSQSTEQRGVASPAIASGKHVTPKPDATHSKYFPPSSSTMKSSGARTSQSGRRNGSTQYRYTALDSSDREEADQAETCQHQLGGKTGKSPSAPPIDLTEDD